MSHQRLDYRAASPDAFKAILGVESYVRGSGLEQSLLELVKMRASQINGCAFCLNMHSQDARKAGETEQRLYVLQAWRETDLFTDRERAALAWTEAVTQISNGAIADEIYGQVRRHFDDKSLVDLTVAVIAINAWNRLAIPFRSSLTD